MLALFVSDPLCTVFYVDDDMPPEVYRGGPVRAEGPPRRRYAHSDMHGEGFADDLRVLLRAQCTVLMWRMIPMSTEAGSVGPMKTPTLHA